MLKHPQLIEAYKKTLNTIESCKTKKQLEIQTKSQDKKMEKHLKELPFIIGKVVGQIELAQDTINRKM